MALLCLCPFSNKRLPLPHALSLLCNWSQRIECVTKIQSFLNDIFFCKSITNCYSNNVKNPVFANNQDKIHLYSLCMTSDIRGNILWVLWTILVWRLTVYYFILSLTSFSQRHTNIKRTVLQDANDGECWSENLHFFKNM